MLYDYLPQPFMRQFTDDPIESYHLMFPSQPPEEVTQEVLDRKYGGSILCAIRRIPISKENPIFFELNTSAYSHTHVYRHRGWIGSALRCELKANRATFMKSSRSASEKALYRRANYMSVFGVICWEFLECKDFLKFEYSI
jgi:hypothetical protein